MSDTVYTYEVKLDLPKLFQDNPEICVDLMAEVGLLILKDNPHADVDKLHFDWDGQITVVVQLPDVEQPDVTPEEVDDKALEARIFDERIEELDDPGRWHPQGDLEPCPLCGHDATIRGLSLIMRFCTNCGYTWEEGHSGA